MPFRAANSDILTQLRSVHWRLIAAIGSTGQLQAAAQMCNMTQPAASRMLAEIERTVAVRLFDRGPKGMTATDEGDLLIQRARILLQDISDTSRALSELREGRGGTIRVGAVTGASVGYLVPAIRKLRAVTTNVEITVDVAPSSSLALDLASGQLDLAISRIPADVDRSAFDLAPGKTEKIVLMVRKEHPLLRAKSVGLPDLLGYEWVMQARGNPIREAIDSAFADRSLRSPANVINSSSLLVTIALLSRTDAIAPMSTELDDLLTNQPVAAGFAALRLETEIVVPPYYVLTQANRFISPATQRLRALILAEIAASRTD